MEDDFERREYANKSGQEREDEARRRALRGQMEWQDGCGERKALFREPEESSWKEDGSIRRNNGTIGPSCTGKIVLLSRLAPIRVLIKPGPHFSRFLAKSYPAKPRFPSSLSVSLNPPLSSFYRPRLDPSHGGG